MTLRLPVARFLATLLPRAFTFSLAVLIASGGLVLAIGAFGPR